MEEETRLMRWWAGLDRLLLAAVFVLLALCWLRVRPGADWPVGRRPAARQAAGEAPEPTLRAPRLAVGPGATLVDSRVRHIARAMAESEWESLPASPAADMRERDGAYDITCSLPRGVDAQGVRVSTSGNVLTLFLGVAGQPAPVLVKRFYVPCGADRPGAVETSVSNDTVRIRVRPPPAP